MNSASPSTTKTLRIPWIDVAKAIGIVFVFHGHLVQRFVELGTPAALHQMKWIYSFHMPLFFLLLGLVYKEREIPFQQFMKRQLLTRLVPAWAFNVASMLGWIVQEHLRGESGWVHQHGWLALVQHCASKLVTMILQGHYAWNVLTWFLICMFTIELWQFSLRRLTRKNRYLVVSIVCFGILATLSNLYSDAIYTVIGVRRHWWYITSGLAVMFFYQLGILLQRSGFLARKRPPLQLCVLGVTCLAVTLATYNLNDLSAISAPAVVLVIAAKYGDMWWFFVSSLAGAFFVIWASQLLARSRVLNYVGRITLALMCLDGILFDFLNPGLARLVMRLIPEPNALLATGVCALGTVLSIMICIPITSLLRCYLPFVLGGRAAKRGQTGRPWRSGRGDDADSSTESAPDER